MKQASIIYKSGAAAVVVLLLQGPGMAAAADEQVGQAAGAAGHIAPPPRPIASELVKLDNAGEAPDVRERNHRAHHDKSHIKKDKTRDDTFDVPGQQKKSKD